MPTKIAIRVAGCVLSAALLMLSLGARAVSAKSLLESGVVAYGGEVVVSARVLAEPREQLDGSSEVGEGVVAGVAGERCEACVVVMQARVVRHVLEGAADRFERVGVSLFAVGRHRLSVERPG